ncbi:MAG: DUF4340 domain-containing protein [Nibricoccus sp.]
MRTKVTLILLLLNVALFAFIYYTRVDDVVKDTAILGPETSNIQTLVIATASADTPVKKIERGGPDVAWTLTEPLQWPAKEHAVHRIISELQQLRPDASFAVSTIEKAGQTLDNYGLEKPLITLTYTPAATTPNTTPKSVVLKIGSATPAGNRIYILSPDGEQIHVVNRSLAESLSLPLEDLRADTLFSIQVFEVRTFKLQPPGNAVATSINYDNNRFVFQSPFKDNDVRANKAETVLTINKLQALRVKEFLDPRTIDNTRTGLAAPSLQITLIGNNRRETLLLGSTVEPTSTNPPPVTTPGADSSPTIEYYAKMEDKAPIFKIALPVKLVETLDNAQEDLRDRQVLDFDPANVTTVTLSAPNTPQVTLQRLDSAAPGSATTSWQVVRNNGESGPQTYPADHERIAKLLEKLARLSAEKFVDDAPSASALEDFGFNRPAREISLTLARPQPGAAGTVTTLQIGAKSEDDPVTFAKLTSHRYIYRVASSILADTPTTVLAYRNRLIRELPVGAQITALKLTSLDPASNNAVLLDVTLPLSDTATPDVLPPQRRAAIEALASQLRSLRAKNLLREEFPTNLSIAGVQRPWRYRLDTTLTLVGGASTQTTTHTLYFTERLGGTTQYVGSPDLLLVFEAEQPLIDTLFTLVYGSKDPGPTPEPPVTPKTP